MGQRIGTADGCHPYSTASARHGARLPIYAVLFAGINERVQVLRVQHPCHPHRSSTTVRTTGLWDRPILNRQIGNVTKVALVTGDQHTAMRHGCRCDSQIHLAQTRILFAQTLVDPG